MRRRVARFGSQALGNAAITVGAALLLLGGAGAVRASAQCDSWTGLAGDGSWTTAGNWSGGVPNSSTTSACITLSGAAVSLVAGDSIASLTVGSSDTLNLNDVKGVGSALLEVWGSSVSNSGNISLNSIGDFVELQIENASTTLSGGGTVTLVGGPGGAFINTGNLSGAALINQETIQGTGQLGEGTLTVANQGTVNANVSGQTLIVSSGPQMTNTSTMKATGGGILELADNFTNTGGTIEAIGTGSEVLFCNANITGGTLTDSSGGVLVSGASSLCGDYTGATWNTLTNTGTYQLQNGTYTYINGTITNNGSIQINSTGSFTELNVPTSATLAGTGTVTLSGGPGGAFVNTTNINGATFTNQETIQGTGQVGEGTLAVTNQGTINANVSGQTLIVSSGPQMTNTKTLEATGGGILELANNFTNTGGTIEAIGAGSEVLLCNANITGGTLTDSGGGVLISGGSSLCTTTGATWNGPLTNAGTYEMQSGTATTISGTITNTGAIELNSVSSNTELLIPAGGSATLAGTGAVIMSGPDAFIIDASGISSGTLVNQETIEGAGNIGQGNLGVTNSGTINANTSGQGIGINPGGAGLNNTGTLIVGSGATMDVYNTLLNLSGTTLTGGVY
ncbi:MAG TPA: hypothetical protein VG860_22790, partial [Terriglobia bacterium]|nr:hypothetical protein [Terriglobia bacterium]